TGSFVPEASGGVCKRAWEINMPHDGGSHWRPQSLPKPQGIQAGETVLVESVGAFSHRTDGVVSLRVRQPGQNTYPDPNLYLYRTSDGGDHWSNLTRLPSPGASAFGSMDFIDANHWIAWPRGAGLMR